MYILLKMLRILYCTRNELIIAGNLKDPQQTPLRVKAINNMRHIAHVRNRTQLKQDIQPFMRCFLTLAK